MKYRSLVLCFAATLWLAPARGQSPFYSTPVRVFGQVPDPSAPGQSKSYAPNLVEGREFYAPQSVALDVNANPPILYVADTANNRVLAWRNAVAASGAAQADLVIGQLDLNSTRPDYPSLRTGLESPSALAVDAAGNLYVLDAANNRILRFPKPFEDTNVPKLPDAVIGQPDFTAQTANTGGVSAKSLSVGILPGALLFDTAGNLYVTDSANNRVLRYDKATLDDAAGTEIPASAALGQLDLNSNSGTNTFNLLNKFNNPTALAMDAAGNLFVADRMHRVLVFRSGGATGQSAFRMIGIPATTPPSSKSLLVPQGLATIGSDLIVADTLNNRILRFPPVDQWPAAPDTPAATMVIGQSSFTTKDARQGSNGLSTPMHVAASGTDLYVADTGNNRIIVFPYPTAPTGTTASRILGQFSPDYGGVNLVESSTLFSAGSISVAGGRITVGGSTALDTRSNPPRLYVADTFNSRVLGFCDARTVKPGENPTLVIGQPDLLQSRPNYNADGSSNRNDSNLFMPMGLAVDASGNLFVADYGNGRVLRFPSPCSNAAGPHRANLVVGQFSFTTRDTVGTDRLMVEPYGVALMPEGHLLVSDRACNRVLLFKKPDGGDFTSGQPAATAFGQPGTCACGTGSSEANGMRDPRYIATDTSGRLYVADFGNRRMLIFTEVASAPSGPFPALTVTHGTGTEGLQNPHGITVDAGTGDIWLTTLGDNRYPLYRYPEFVTLSFSQTPNANLRLSMITPGMGLALDGNGNLFATEQGNRLSQYVPPAEATDGGNFVAGRPLAPGMIATLWPLGGRLFRGVETDSFDWHDPLLVPLPKTLADTQLLVNGQLAPLYYVSAGQINFQVPQATPANTSVEVQVLRASTGEVLAAGRVPILHAQPAFLMLSGGPFAPGQVAAMNDSDKSCNGPEVSAPELARWCPGGVRPARRGEWVNLFMIGSGVFANMPADGEPASGAISTDRNDTLRVVIGTAPPFANVNYSGTAPGLIGVWQINVQVPSNAPPGSVPVGVQYRDIVTAVPAGYKTPIITVK